MDVGGDAPAVMPPPVMAVSTNWETSEEYHDSDFIGVRTHLGGQIPKELYAQISAVLRAAGHELTVHKASEYIFQVKTP